MISLGDVECIGGPLDGRVLHPATWPPAPSIEVLARIPTRCAIAPQALAPIKPPPLPRHLYELHTDRAGRFCYVHRAG